MSSIECSFKVSHYNDFPNRHKDSLSPLQVNTWENRKVWIKSPYQSCIAKRTVCVIIVILAVSAYFLTVSGQLTTLPQNFVHWLHNVSWMKVTIGVGIVGFLATGAFIVIHRVRKKIDPITERPIGNLKGDAHWERAHLAKLYCNGKIGIGNFNIDKSTLKDGTGRAYGFYPKSCCEHYAISTFMTALTPTVHMVGAIAYNIIEMILFPFYVLGSMAFEKCYKGSPIYDKEGYFKFKHIPQQWWDSIKQIVKASVYATAMFFAALYSFVEPAGGRKLGACIARDWHNDVTRAEAFWSVQGPQALWEWTFGPKSSRRKICYIAGCWQPVIVIEYKNHEAQKAYSLSHATNLLNEKEGRGYAVIKNKGQYFEIGRNLKEVEGRDGKKHLIALTSQCHMSHNKYPAKAYFSRAVFNAPVS